MDPIITNIDERWMAEWVTFGIGTRAYLGKHRCFEEYYSRRNRSHGAPALDGSTATRSGGPVIPT